MAAPTVLLDPVSNASCLSSQEAKANFMKNPTSNLDKAASFYKSEHKG
jgi:hypothetical protein